jgi:Na+/melibiose symporter-like transporter
MFTVIPAAMTLVAIGITFAYNLTSKNEQQIKEELAARRAQAGDA